MRVVMLSRCPATHHEQQCRLPDSEPYHVRGHEGFHPTGEPDWTASWATSEEDRARWTG